MPGTGSRRYLAGRIEPFPTRLLDVSGRKKIIRVKHKDAAMQRNQKIHGQPAA